MQEWAQFEATYGKEAASTFWNQADIKQVFAIQEESVVRLIKPRLGTCTWQSVSRHERPEKDNLPPYSHQPLFNWCQQPLMFPKIEMSYSYSDVAVPLLHEYELYQMPEWLQLIFHANLPPILANKFDYTANYNTYKYRAKPNPLYPPLIRPVSRPFST